jgi:hypothetical protein
MTGVLLIKEIFEYRDAHTAERVLWDDGGRDGLSGAEDSRNCWNIREGMEHTLLQSCQKETTLTAP